MKRVSQRFNYGRLSVKVLAVLVILAAVVAAAIFYGPTFLAEKGINLPWQKSEAPMAEPETSAPAPASTSMPATVPPAGLKLANTVLNGNREERKAAVNALGALTDPQPETVTTLSQSLSTSSAPVQISILSALVALAPKNPTAVDALVGALRERSLRRDAIQSVGKLGPLAASAVPTLKKIAAGKNEKASMQKAATAAIAKIEGKPGAAKKGKKKAQAKAKK